MKKRTLIGILGLAVSVVAFAGLIGVWKKDILIILGFAIAYLAFSHSRPVVASTETNTEDINSSLEK